MNLPLSMLRRAACALVLSGLAAGAAAQALPAGVRLGMSADELQSALPALERVARPQRLAGGLAGSWRAPPTQIAGLAFEPVFFFASGQLRRVEWAASAAAEPDRGAAAFDSLVAWGRGSFGPELGSSDPGSAYAAWVQGDWDIYLQRSTGGDARHAGLRLVYKARQLKDASQL